MKNKLLIFLSLLLLFSCDIFEKDNKINQNNNATGLELASYSDLSTIPIATPPPSSGVSLPDSFDLSQHLPPVRSQGADKGSCASWATGYYLKSFHEKLDQNSSFGNNHSGEYSPDFLFNVIKISADCKSSKIKDNLERLKNVGICSWNDMPYSVTDCATQPQTTAVNNASCAKILNYSMVYSQATGANTNQLINISKEFIYSNTPIVIAYPLDQNWANATPLTNGEYIYKNYSSNEHLGYHASLIVGYDDNKNAFKVVNSWGDNWGNDGFFWFDYDLFEDVLNEAYVTEDEINNCNGQNPSNEKGVLKVINTSTLIQKFRIKKTSEANYGNYTEANLSGGTQTYYYNLDIGTYDYQSTYGATYGGGGLRSGQLLITENDTTVHEIVY